MQLKEKLKESIASLFHDNINFAASSCGKLLSDEMLHIDIFQNFQISFFHYICTYIYSYKYTHILNYFSYLQLFSLLKFCTIWKHWLVSTVMSCLKALPSGENRKHPHTSKRFSDSIYWPINLLPCSYWTYHKHDIQGWPTKSFQICGNVKWL